jgi:retron-type reverse transcriptase
VTAPAIFSGRRVDRDRGLPQGSAVSPLLANLYLDTFDEELLDQGFRLVRFADDFVVLAKDPSKAPCRPLF